MGAVECFSLPIRSPSVAVHNPDYIAIILLSTPHSLCAKGRVLYLDDQPMGSLDVRNVPFVGHRIRVHDFLPVNRETILPRTMPFRFRVPPCIAVLPRFVCPMLNDVLSALWDHLAAAAVAYAPQTRPGFSSLVVDDRISHGSCFFGRRFIAR